MFSPVRKSWCWYYPLARAWGQLRPTQTKPSDSLEGFNTHGTGSVCSTGSTQTDSDSTLRQLGGLSHKRDWIYVEHGRARTKYRYHHSANNSSISTRTQTHNIISQVAVNRSIPTLAKGRVEAFARKNARRSLLVRMAAANVGIACCATLKHRTGQHCCSKLCGTEA